LYRANDIRSAQPLSKCREALSVRIPRAVSVINPCPVRIVSRVAGIPRITQRSGIGSRIMAPT
jgi:hypothetical protein